MLPSRLKLGMFLLLLEFCCCFENELLIPSRAVHINGLTVHDEAPLPHGGWKSSGFGRFAGATGYNEFLQTKTITWAE